MQTLSQDPVLSLEDLIRFQRPVPRYTSYPSVPYWGDLSADVYEKALRQRSLDKNQPISVYIHVPFCKTMCLFCGCHVILNRMQGPRLHYADLVDLEIEKVGKTLLGVPISQLHLGGGTPTYMPLERLSRWIELLKKHQGFTQEAEISIEIDPRTVIESQGQMLHELKSMGFNRVSFGVQDLDEEVQEAIRRRQTAQMSRDTLIWAKEAGFEGVNVDLIYGLPKQTAESFAKTIEQLCQWRPSRVALFSYANVPWLKAHQKMIASQLPKTEDKLALYIMARDLFLEKGYVQIGMDHFALPTDEMAKALDCKELQRNFQGYSLHRSKDLIGLGVSSTGYVEGLYVQNIKEIDSYERFLKEDQWAIYKGKILSEEDRRRHWVIQRLMCDFSLLYDDYRLEFGRDFKKDFFFELENLQKEPYNELIKTQYEALVATGLGRIFIRVAVSLFDAYLHKSSQNRFSMSI